jgi:GTP-binding protein
MYKKLPLVVIFGRANVGKSTLFNCLLEKRKALVSPVAGTTRDSNIGEIEWQGKKICLVDTGGILDIKYLSQKLASKKKINLGGQTSDIEVKVQEQAREYIKMADLILFLVDARAGLLPQDRQMAVMVKKILAAEDAKNEKSAKNLNKKIILAANKADNPQIRRDVAEFNKLGLGEPIAISATTGSGTGDLLDIILKQLPNKKIKAPTEEKEIVNSINVCIVGKPNVGKSSLINKLLGEDRFIVSSIPHTTREPQDITINYKNNQITFVDTAGLSRKGQKEARKASDRNSLEKLSIGKSLQALNRADIALLVIDCSEPLGAQETKIVDEIIAKKAGLIIIANKWDLVAEKDVKKFTHMIYSDFPFITWAPIQYCSALTGEKIGKICDLILEVAEARRTEIQENALNKFIIKIIKRQKPAKGKNARTPHIFEFKQIKNNPPVFSLRVGVKDDLQYSYIRYVENRLREKFGFIGVPISIWVERKKRVHGKAEENDHLGD